MAQQSDKAKKEKITGTQAQAKPNKEVFVIGIGASAGGLQALEALFSSVPHDSVAYVIVQHLSSEHRSMLAELLAQQSVLEVVEAEHDVPVEINKVYIIPNDKELTIQGNHLQLNDKNTTGLSRTIDTFFKSLAADKGSQAVGIILSGTGSDGTEGIVAIKKAGGVVIVQDPATAKFDGMPRNAINTGYADYVLAPEEMPHEIFNMVKVRPVAQEVSDLVNSDNEPSFLLILDIIQERTGVDFSNYKRPTIIRRISRRMALTNVRGVVDYLDYLQLHPEEVEILSNDLLIGVTKFFRDKEAFNVLSQQVIPVLIDGKDVRQQLRVWVAGCSTGEEAYSIAILIREYMDKVKKELEVKIFASDIDRDSLDFAGKGLYAAESLTDVSEERLNTHFVQEDGKYRVNQRVRRMVIFAPHNVINDPPFSKVDLVSCRNMLIYLNPMLQKRVIEKFHYALLMGGFLFLGTSESIGEKKNFVEVSKKWKIFRNMEPAHALGMDAFQSSGLSRKSMVTTASGYGRELPTKQVVQHNFSELLNETILEEYGYAAVFIDEHYDVLHGVGRFKDYLDLPEHTFTFNLLKLVPSDLALNLGTLLRRSIRDKVKVAARGIQVREGNKLRYINVVVKPYMLEKKLYQKFILVLFGEDRPQVEMQAGQEGLLKNFHYEERVQELETELQHTKDDLQSVVEELETSNEELQSTNEELLSSNEELQSTNEELQSLNEELHTINTEHQYKIKALVELDNDLNNYFRSTDIGQIFVDRELVIRKYTPAATRLINLIESDIGRSIYQISNNLRYENLIEDVRSVISNNQQMEQEVQDKNGFWYQMRILPYITQERRVDGAIIIFIQINEIKTLQLLHAGILNSSPNGIMALKAVRDDSHAIVDFVPTITNSKTLELLKHPKKGLIGTSLRKQAPYLLEQGVFERLVHVVETADMLDVELPQSLDEQQFWLHIVAVKFDDGLVLTLHNITDRKQYEQALKEQQELIKTNAERFRTLLEAVPHITWTNLPTGENSSFNEFWYEYTGLSEEESAGWGWKQAFHPDDLKELFPVYEKCLQTGEALNVQARILRRSDERFRWHIVKNIPIRNDAGEITLWVGTATDIQDYKDSERENTRLQLSQQRELLSTVLKTQENERSRISEALHNGLGQVLYAAKLNLDSLNGDCITKDSAAWKAKENVSRLLTEGIKITRDISFELTPAVLKEFGIKTAVAEIISRFNNPSLKITSKITGMDKTLDYNIAISLYRIIQELLNNVAKHAQATKASVELSRKNRHITLLVQDNGIGMGLDKDKHKNKPTEGSGLGNIQNRVDLLGGTLEINSEKGKGTSVKITCQAGA